MTGPVRRPAIQWVVIVIAALTIVAGGVQIALPGVALSPGNRKKSCEPVLEKRRAARVKCTALFRPDPVWPHPLSGDEGGIRKGRAVEQRYETMKRIGLALVRRG